MTSKIKLTKTEFYKKLFSCAEVDIVYNESFAKYKERVKQQIANLKISELQNIDSILKRETITYPMCTISNPAVVNIDLLNTVRGDVPKTFKLSEIVGFYHNGTAFTKGK